MKSFPITLNFSEIEFNVKYECMKQAKLAGIKGDVLKEYSFTSSDDNWLSRSIETALSAIMQTFASAISNNTNAASDEIDSQVSSYSITFNLPDDWNGRSDVLASALNSFVTQFCVAEFMKLVGSQSYTVLREAADNYLSGHCSLIVFNYSLPVKKRRQIISQDDTTTISDDEVTLG